LYHKHKYISKVTNVFSILCLEMNGEIGIQTGVRKTKDQVINRKMAMTPLKKKHVNLEDLMTGHGVTAKTINKY